MIDQDRNTGVTEARFGLTLLIVLVSAIGFVVLMRLGGATDPTADIGPAEEIVQEPSGDPTTPSKYELVPQVLPIEPEDVKPIALRPERPKTDHRGGTGVRNEFPVLPTGSTDPEPIDSQRR